MEHGRGYHAYAQPSFINCRLSFLDWLIVGGGDSIIELPVQVEPASQTGSQMQQLKISGLMGGHSGLNISEDRGNAVLLAAQVLQAVLKGQPEVRLVSLTAGDKRNAIAREATAFLEVTHVCRAVTGCVPRMVGQQVAE